MKPLMYGYMRVEKHDRDGDVAQMERALRFYSENEGYCFAAIFQEHELGSHAALIELTEELKRAEARHMIVPTYDHISAHPLIQQRRLERLEQFGIRVHVLAAVKVK